MPSFIQKKELLAIHQHDFHSLSREELIEQCINFHFSINILYERLDMSSQNSSLSSSSLLPWQQWAAVNDPEISEQFSEEIVEQNNQAKSKHKNKADVRKRRQHGVGRTQRLVTKAVVLLAAECCADCGYSFGENDHRCYRAFNQVDLKRKDGEDSEYEVYQTRYKLHDSCCPKCNTITHTTLSKPKTDIENKEITVQGLIGPELASILIHMHKNDGVSFRKIKATIKRLYAIKISIGAICMAVNEGGLCCEEQVESYRLEAEAADYAHMDETGWKDGGDRLWLWVVVTATICLFMIGRRTKKMALSFLDSNFNGWLMSDGYNAYRNYKKRFRCWAHLLRKAKGLSESKLSDVKNFGVRLLELLNTCMSGIYAARENGIITSIHSDFDHTLASIKNLCESNKDSDHPKVKSLAREFLKDWSAIFRILEYPYYPLTNNEAERALRHWVILRKVILGTQSEIGRRATCAIASMIATGKRRSQDCILNIKCCIEKTRGILNRIDYQPLRLSG